MTDLELLECAQSVYDFLIDDTRLNKSFSSFCSIPSFKKMNHTLVKYEYKEYDHLGDYILFTLVINGIWGIYEQNDFRKLLRTSPKDFFSSTKSHDFYRTILRDLKLKLYLD